MDFNTALIDRLKKVECQDATFTNYTRQPVVFNRAKGSIIEDCNGKQYIDFCAGFGALPLGHSHAEVQKLYGQMIDAQMPPIEHGMGDVFPSKDKVEYLEILHSMLPQRYGRGALSISGTGAVELALKTIQLQTGNAGIVSFDGSYHGVDLGVLPVTSREDFSEPFKMWNYNLPTVSLEFNQLANIEDRFKNSVEKLRCSGHGFAGIIVEPIQGRAGNRVASSKWLEKVISLTHRYGGLVVFDEVFVGFGRTGRISFAEIFDSDLSCFGKAIGGGMPISACFGTESAFAGWPESRGEAIHTGTFFGHPLSCRIGLKTLYLMKNEGVLERVNHKGQLLNDLIEESLGGFSSFRRVRFEGLMVTVEFTMPLFGAKLLEFAAEYGLIILPCGNGSMISLTPALNIEDSLLIEGVARLKSAVKLAEKMAKAE